MGDVDAGNSNIALRMQPSSIALAFVLIRLGSFSLVVLEKLDIVIHLAGLRESEQNH